MSTRLGAAPRTPTNNDRRTKIRRFGTVLSVNSPVTTPARRPPNKKISRIPGDSLLHTLTILPSSSSSSPLSHHHAVRTTTIPEENEDDIGALPFHSSESTGSTNTGTPAPTGAATPSSTTYTVTFDAGPIGLQIDPDTWCVQQVIGPDSPAAMIGTIHQGDTVVAVNHMSTTAPNHTDDDIFNVLQDVTTRRTITFRRHDNDTHPNIETPLTALHTATEIVPTNDVENRKPIPGTARLHLKASQSLSFGLNHHPTTSAMPTETTTENSMTPHQPVPNELMMAHSQIQQLQIRLAAMEAENEQLKRPPPQPSHPESSSPPPMKQQFSAIREMEYQMRIQALEEQLKQANESKAKVKEHNKRINQMLVHQSENHQQVVTKKEQELQDGIAASKETMKELELTRKELMLTTKQRNDDVDVLRQEKEQLQATLEQTAIDLERQLASKAQSEARIQQLEGKCFDFSDQVQRLRDKVDKTERHAQQTNDEFLQIIRTKDEEMEQLRIDMVNVQTINDKFHTDLTEREATLRHLRAEREQWTTLQQSGALEVRNLSSTLEMTQQEQERLEGQLVQVEEKLAARNQTIESLKVTMKSMQDEALATLQLKEDEWIKVNEALTLVSSERDQFQQQWRDLQTSVSSQNQSAMQLRRQVTQQQAELEALRQSSTNEKCNLLKQLEQLEGTLKHSQTTIQQQQDALTELHARLDTMASAMTQRQVELEALRQSSASEKRELQEQLEEIESAWKCGQVTIQKQNDTISESNARFSTMSAQLEIYRTEVVTANAEQERLETTIAEWKEQVATMERDHHLALQQLQIQLKSVTEQSIMKETSHQRLMVRMDAQQHRKLLSACGTELQFRLHQKQHLSTIGQLEQTLQHERDRSATERGMLEAAVSNKNDLLESITLERNMSVSQVAMLESNLQRSTTALSRIEFALETELLRNIELEVRYQQVAESAMWHQQQWNDLRMASREELRVSHCQYKDLQETYAKVTVELEQVLKASQAQNNEMLRLTSQVATISTTLEEIQESARRRNDELQEEIRATQVELDEAKHRLEVSEKSQSETNAELVASRTLIDNLSTDLRLQQSELETTLLLVSKLESENGNLMTEISRMNTEMAQMTNELQSAAATKETNDAMTEELKDSIRELQLKYDSDCAMKDMKIEEMARERDDAVVESFMLRDNIEKEKVKESILQSEVEQLRIQLTNAEADFQKSDELASDQANESEKFHRKYTEQKSRADKLLLELQQSESSVDSLSRILDSTNAQVTSLKQSIASKANEFENKLDTMNAELIKYKKLNETLTDENSEFLERISKLETSYSNAKETADILNRKLSTAESKLAITVSTASANEGEFLLQQELLQRDIKCLTSSLEARDKHISELSEKLGLAEEAKQKVTSQLLDVENELKRVYQDLSSVQVQLDESRKQETTVAARINETWSSKLDDISEKNKLLLLKEHERTVALDNELRALQSKYDVMIPETNSLKEALCEMEAKNAALTKRVAAFELDLSNANVLISASEIQVHEKSRKLSSAENRIAEANLQISDLKAGIENLLRNSSSASNAAAIEITQLKEASELMKAEFHKIEAECKTLRKSISDRDDELEGVREELRVQTEAVTGIAASAAATQWTLESKIEALNMEVSKYRDLSSDLNSECNDLKSELDSLHEKVDSMKEELSSTVSNFEIVASKLSEQKNEFSERLSIEMDRSSQLTDELSKLKLERQRELSDLVMKKEEGEETIRLLKHEADLKSQRQADWTKEREIERAELYQCREELHEAATKVSILESSIAEMKSEAASSMLKAEQTKIENESKLEQLARSHAAEKSALKEEISRLQNDVTHASSTSTSLAERLRLVDDQLVALQSDQNDLIGEKNTLLSIIEEKNTSIQALQAELKDRTELSLDADESESPSKSLSNSELKHRCSLLQDELINAENRLKASNEAVSRRSQHVDQLADDLNDMSNEISRLVSANELLETRLQDVSSLYAASEESIAKAHKVVNGLQAQLKNRTEKLDEMSSRNESLVDQLQIISTQSNSDRRLMENEKNAMEEDLRKTRRDIREEIARRERAEKSLSDIQLDLTAVRTNEEFLHTTIKQLEQEVKNKMGAFDSTVELNKELSNKLFITEEKVSNLQNECTKLRSRISELQLDIESNEISLRNKAERERLLTDDVTRQRQNAAAAEQQREGIVAKLTEATRVVSSQRDAIKKLESRVCECDRTIAELTVNIEALQTTNQQRETNISESESLANDVLRDLKTKLNSLDEERAAAVHDANNTRDELRKVRHDLSESERANVMLQKQVKELSHANDLSRAQITEAKNSRDETLSSLRKLTNELDNKQMEIDHLKAKVQVSTATVARLKANVLLQESTYKTERNGAVESNIGEIAKLKEELKDRSSKLISVSEVCKSQEQALSFSRKLESQLVRFIEEIISEVDNMLGNIALRTESLYEHADQYQIYESLKSLDLAGFDRTEPSSATMRTSLDSLSVLIPRAANQLDERRAQLCAWKEQRSDQFETNANTPKAKRLDVVPATPEILDTLHRMRNFLKTDMLSPIKIRTSHSDQLDVEFFKQVIHTLEGNIDVLLQDLQAANTALQEKDDRISALETFIASHHQSTDEKVPPPSNHQATTMPHIENDSHDDGSQSTQENRSDFDGRKRAAGRLLLHALEGRTNAAKAVAFRRWSCQTSAMRAIAKHGHTATALAQQLEETREKLLILKRHLKKARRSGSGGTVSSIKGGAVGTLDRIPEDEHEV